MADSLILPQTGAASTQPVSGTVTANQGTGGVSAWKVDGSAVTQPVSGTVAVSNFPATQTITGTTNQGTANSVANAWPVKVTDGTYTESLFPAGFLRVTDEPTQQFYDPFDGSVLDTTNRWSAPVTGNAGIAATVTSGMMSLGSGTTANGYSVLTSQPSFVPTIPAWLGNSWAMQFESGTTKTNAYRFWGVGTPQAVPTTAAPIVNGYGWEIDTSGNLNAVIWAGGVRTAVASSIASKPTDGAYHRYIIYYRTDAIYWYIDSIAATALVATATFIGPQGQTLPLVAMSVGGATPPATSATLTTTGLAVWDTGKNNQTISDGLYRWRTVQVGSNGALSVATIDSSKASYSAAAAFSPTTTAATDIFTITGSATKTVRITKLSVSGSATASTAVSVSLIRRSTVDTGGTSAAVTVVPNDTTNAAGTATCLSYTANPTVGNTVGTIRADRLTFSPTAPSLQVYTFGGSAQSIVLRGTSQQLAINLNGATVASIAASVSIEWTEE